ncbi:MAG: DUF4493 domain-containing protein [Muribaculaceae bacterium]|nr:DUF4493 domain-containing protein [Muribaculaceae bacterium]
MKKFFSIILAMASITAVSTSCSDDRVLSTGEGKVNLSLTVDDDVTILSRAISDAELASLQENCRIYVYSSKGLIRKYHGTDEVPNEIWLVSGDYKAEAWAGDSVSASFDKKYYKGSTMFTVSPSATAEAKINCKIANVVASVTFDASVAKVLSDYKMTISNTKGSLEFDASNTGAKGYYMMLDGENKLNYIITGTKLDGSTYTQTGEISDVKSATEYAVTVKFTEKEFDPVGGAMFTIEVDESEVEVNDSFELTAAPKITANFDLTQPKAGEAGSFSKMSIYASAVEEITSLELSGLNKLGFTQSDVISYMDMTDITKQELSDFGIEIKCPFATEEYPDGDKRAAKITFTAELLNSLGNGSYSIGIKVGDNKGKYRTATFNLEVSDDAVKTTQVADADVWATRAVLTATLAKENATGIGVEYRTGSGDWNKIYVETEAARSTSFTVELTELTPGTKYEYRAFADNDGDGNPFTSGTIYTFTTETASQLPNSGFEDWCQPAKVVLPAATEGTLYWDSGNHGSATLGKNITNKDESVKNSGNYSAKLQSQFVGLGVIGKFAAGNIFTGKYLATDGTDGVLGFGRSSFTSRPKSLSGYVKYNPSAVDNITNDAKANGCVEGANDKGHIYVALLTDYTETYSDNTYPMIIKTKTSDRRLFDKNGSNVIAYGEWTSQEATSSDNTMTPFEIQLTYKRTDVKPSAILVVCSASYWGDYFSGGEGSVMYIDDFTLNY